MQNEGSLVDDMKGMFGDSDRKDMTQQLHDLNQQHETELFGITQALKKAER